MKRTTALEANWFAIRESDVELPDGSVGRGWHWIDFYTQAVGVVPVRDDGAILLVNHYRFTTRTRDWEIPAGRVDESEAAQDAALRELQEETGHSARALEALGHYHPSNGSSNQEFVLFVARDLERISAIQDTNEVDEIKWFARDEVRAMLSRNEILDGMSATGLLWYFLMSSSERQIWTWKNSKKLLMRRSRVYPSNFGSALKTWQSWWKSGPTRGRCSRRTSRIGRTARFLSRCAAYGAHAELWERYP